jgi:hypothetical protein
MTMMYRLIISALIFAFFHLSLAQSLYNDRDEGRKVYQRYKNRPKGSFSKILDKGDRAIGVMDRGEIANVTGNFGVISNFHLFSPAMHWPSWVDDTHQYCFGLQLLVGYQGDVVTSIHDPSTVAENYDWEAQDGSYGNLYSGNVTVSDGTPVLASSDISDTWPLDASNRPFWPGSFRFDPATGGEKSGEFVSERDVYGVLTDQNNINGSYGLVVKQKTYSFSRSYAKDFLIFDFTIINTSSDSLDSVWVGYMADFKVDFDAHDHIRFSPLENGNPNKPEMVYLWDADPNAGIWDVTGYIGFLPLFTPNNRGITDFHYFDNIYEPSTNEQLWEIMTSDTSGGHITPSLYFHGENYRIDDDALADDLDPSGNKLGTDFVFILSTGPVSIGPGDSLRSAFAAVLGANRDGLFANAEMVKNMAAQNYLGPNAPPSPNVQGFTESKKAIITWDGSKSETARDLLSGLMDFEGYRIYRSEDFGLTWGDPITDERGALIGYVPLAQYDLDNNVSGKDPNSNFYLGENTGLKHTYVDSTVYNGKEYWYSVTAYDRGDIGTSLPALESPRGVTPDEPNVVRITPMGSASNVVISPIPSADSLPPIGGGSCDSRLSIEIFDPNQLTGHQYRITFNDVGKIIRATEEGEADTTYETTYNLIDLITQDTLLQNHPLIDETGDNVSVVHGFRVIAREADPGVKSMGWTLVQGDTCTYEWRVTNFETVATNPQVGPEDIYTGDDFRLRVDYSPGGGSNVSWYDIFTGQQRDSSLHIPLDIELITDINNPIDIGSSSLLLEYDLFNSFPNRDQFFSPLGWDLQPGGAGFNPNPSPPGYLWVDIINPEYTITDQNTGYSKPSGLLILTQNYPDTYVNQYGDTINHSAVMPAAGDEFTIITKKLFRSDIYFEFETILPSQAEGTTNLSQVKVVPNPFIVKAGWEQSEFEGRLQFTNLPKECTISIYTTSGDYVTTLYHNNLSDSEFWNLQNDSEVNVAYGLYVYLVKTPDGNKETGKFVIIR